MLVTIEGIDGAGKSTVIELVHGYFAEADPEMPCIVATDFTSMQDPTYLPAMKAEKNPYAQYLLIMGARVHTARKLFPVAKPALIIYDRYLGSTLAYQGSMGIQMHEILDDHLKAGLPIPDLTIILDLPVAVARARRGKPLDNIEKKSDDFFEKVRRGYTLIAIRAHEAQGTTIVLNALEPVEQIASTCVSLIKARLAELAEIADVMNMDVHA